MSKLTQLDQTGLDKTCVQLGLIKLTDWQSCLAPLLVQWLFPHTSSPDGDQLFASTFLNSEKRFAVT